MSVRDLLIVELHNDNFNTFNQTLREPLMAVGNDMDESLPDMVQRSVPEEEVFSCAERVIAVPEWHCLQKVRAHGERHSRESATTHVDFSRRTIKGWGCRQPIQVREEKREATTAGPGLQKGSCSQGERCFFGHDPAKKGQGKGEMKNPTSLRQFC